MQGSILSREDGEETKDILHLDVGEFPMETVIDIRNRYSLWVANS